VIELDGSNRTTILIHFYRAMVARADIWRTRMDTTTNWSIGATAALISFALGDASAPHYVIFIASFLTLIFLALEARRLTFYHLWQQRVLILERSLIEPALKPNASNSAPSIDLEALEARLAPHLGITIPTMPIGRAISRRLRRVYLYLFAVQLLAWLLKLASHPSAATSIRELVSRAAIGPLPGQATLGMVGGGLAVATLLAVFIGRSRGSLRFDADLAEEET